MQVAVRLLPDPVAAAAAHPVIDVAPSRKLTVPVGLVPVTLAVKVTAAPTVDGLSELPSAVVEGPGPGPGPGPLAALTTCDNVALVDAGLPALPL